MKKLVSICIILLCILPSNNTLSTERKDNIFDSYLKSPIIPLRDIYESSIKEQEKDLKQYIESRNQAILNLQLH